MWLLGNSVPMYMPLLSRYSLCLHGSSACICQERQSASDVATEKKVLCRQNAVTHSLLYCSLSKVALVANVHVGRNIFESKIVCLLQSILLHMPTTELTPGMLRRIACEFSPSKGLLMCGLKATHVSNERRLMSSILCMHQNIVLADKIWPSARNWC